MRRKIWQLTVTIVLLATALVGPATAAQAHGVTTLAAAPGACPGSPAYPPAPDATIAASTTTPTINETIKASGTHYCPNEDVTLTIAGKTVGTAHTDGAGTFDPNVVVPGPAGAKPLCGIGASGLATDRDCLTLTVRTTAGGVGTPNSPGGPALTGVEIALLSAVGVLLLAGGVAFATAGRNRKTVAQS